MPILTTWIKTPSIYFNNLVTGIKKQSKRLIIVMRSERLSFSNAVSIKYPHDLIIPPAFRLDKFTLVSGSIYGAPQAKPLRNREAIG